MTQNERITHEPGNFDAWICICGNTPSDAGFYPINEANHEVEPLPQVWTTDEYFCHQCGRVINQHTLEVVRHPARDQIVALADAEDDHLENAGRWAA